MKYKGSCHCGNVAFEVEGTVDRVISCNCSICQRKAPLLWFAPRDKFHLLTPEGNSTTYTFNKHVIQHRFCSTCGVEAYAEGVDPKGNRMAAINVRCLQDVDIASIPTVPFDGRSL